MFLSFCRFCLVYMLSLELCRCSSTFSCPADHVPDWQPRILLVMVEARSVNVQNTTTAIINEGLLFPITFTINRRTVVKFTASLKMVFVIRMASTIIAIRAPFFHIRHFMHLITIFLIMPRPFTVDLQKAYDTFDRTLLWQVLTRIAVPPQMIVVIQQFHEMG